ncbi:MAG: guanylate kinase [Turicibacter sp.]|nr:guanylate kinase [Turicibacter sp.]
MKGMLVIISGPSGSGKGTVVKNLKYALSISVTTRKRRETEEHGVDYFFCTEEEFIRMRENDELLEHAAYVGKFYGTPRKYVEERIDKGEVVVLEIEVNGAIQVKEKFPDAVLIFLIPPSIDDLAKRLAFRNTEDSLEIEDRITRALEEIELIDRYDYLVVNDDIPVTVSEIETIVTAEYLKPHRSKDRIEKFAFAKTSNIAEASHQI